MENLKCVAEKGFFLFTSMSPKFELKKSEAGKKK